MTNYSVEWVNARGTSFWQPAIPDGERLWLNIDGNTTWVKDRTMFIDRPKVYKSRSRAERIAKRHQNRKNKNRIWEKDSKGKESKWN